MMSLGVMYVGENLKTERVLISITNTCHIFNLSIIWINKMMAKFSLLLLNVKGLRIFNCKNERIMISIVYYIKAINVRKYSCDDKAPHTETNYVF